MSTLQNTWQNVADKGTHQVQWTYNSAQVPSALIENRTAATLYVVAGGSSTAGPGSFGWPLGPYTYKVIQLQADGLGMYLAGTPVAGDYVFTSLSDVAMPSAVGSLPPTSVDVIGVVTASIPAGVSINGTPNVAVPGGVGIVGTPNVAVPAGVGITGTATVAGNVNATPVYVAWPVVFENQTVALTTAWTAPVLHSAQPAWDSLHVMFQPNVAARISIQHEYVIGGVAYVSTQEIFDVDPAAAPSGTLSSLSVIVPNVGGQVTVRVIGKAAGTAALGVFATNAQPMCRPGISGGTSPETLLAGGSLTAVSGGVHEQVPIPAYAGPCSYAVTYENAGVGAGGGGVQILSYDYLGNLVATNLLPMVNPGGTFNGLLQAIGSLYLPGCINKLDIQNASGGNVPVIYSIVAPATGR